MTDVAIDTITLDLIENALLNARFEMDEVVRRAAMSPTIRVQHDEFPMICNARGQMVLHARKDGNFDFIFKLQP